MSEKPEATFPLRVGAYDRQTIIARIIIQAHERGEAIDIEEADRRLTAWEEANRRAIREEDDLKQRLNIIMPYLEANTKTPWVMHCLKRLNELEGGKP